jgi:hypothetical protein
VPRSHPARGQAAPNTRYKRAVSLSQDPPRPHPSGGLRYLIVGYGHFHQLVIPGPAGHVSIAFELGANPADSLQAILGVMAHHGQPAV